MRQEKSVPLKSPTHQEYMLYLLKRYFSDFEIECFFWNLHYYEWWKEIHIHCSPLFGPCRDPNGRHNLIYKIII